MRRLTLFLALAAVAFALGSCDKLNPIAWMDKLLQDVDVSLSAPDKVIVTNNAYISSLESFTVVLFRAGSLVHTLRIERGIITDRTGREGSPPENGLAATLAACQEARDIMSGKIPSEGYSDVDEFFADLYVEIEAEEAVERSKADVDCP